jgi:hypothetical protein
MFLLEPYCPVMFDWDRAVIVDGSSIQCGNMVVTMRYYDNGLLHITVVRFILIVAEMNPDICTVLDTLLHRQCLVPRPII